MRKAEKKVIFAIVAYATRAKVYFPDEDQENEDQDRSNIDVVLAKLDELSSNLSMFLRILQVALYIVDKIVKIQ